MKKLKWDGLPLLIFGSSGISKEIYQLIKYNNENCVCNTYDVLGFVGERKDEIGKRIIGDGKIVTCDSSLKDFIASMPIVGFVIPLGQPSVKRKIFERFEQFENVVYPNIIHSDVVIPAETVNLGIGNIITAGVQMTCDIEIGNFNLFNLNCTVGHDTIIKDYNIINPLASISGNVTIENECLIGTGANILQGLTVHKGSVIGGGSVVVRDVASNTTVVGIPAKELNKKEL